MIDDRVGANHVRGGLDWPLRPAPLSVTDQLGGSDHDEG